MFDKKALHDDLTDAFIVYQHRLEQPFPSATETMETMVQKYRNDPLFHARVASLVSGVMRLVSKHI